MPGLELDPEPEPKPEAAPEPRHVLHICPLATQSVLHWVKQNPNGSLMSLISGDLTSSSGYSSQSKVPSGS